MPPPERGSAIVPPFGPLAGLRVVDSGRFVAGPWAGTYLAEFGAEVIHVEGPPFAPPFSDPTRLLPPIVPGDRSAPDAVSESWVQYSRNKLSLALDLKRSEGRELFLSLLERSDVWIESSRPGTYAALGLSDEVIRGRAPRLTIVHVSGFGQTGESERVRAPSFDLIGQAYSGFLSLQGEPDPAPPTRSGTALNDTVTGLAAATAAMMGYIEAERTGRGQSIDVAQYEVFFGLLENLALDYFIRGVVRGRHGAGHARLYPYDLYPCRDGWVVLAAPTAEAWGRVRRLLAIDAPGSEAPAWAREHREEVDARIRQRFEPSTGEELERLGRSLDLAISRVYDIAAIAKDPHYQARGMFLEWDDPVAGRVTGAGISPKFERTPGRVWRGAPWLGQDNGEILGRVLGLTPEQIADLERSAVIGRCPPSAALTGRIGAPP